MKTPTITIDELLAEFNVRPADSDDYHTTGELAELWGVSRSKVLRLLQLAKTAGRLEVRVQAREYLDGKMAPKTCYKIAKAAKKK